MSFEETQFVWLPASGHKGAEDLFLPVLFDHGHLTATGTFSVVTKKQNGFADLRMFDSQLVACNRLKEWGSHRLGELRAFQKMIQGY